MLEILHGNRLDDGHKTRYLICLVKNVVVKYASALGFFLSSGAASAPDFESAAYGSVLYFLEAVLPFLEAFYRDFYFPDQAAHGNEIDETDHIAKAVTVSLLSIKRNKF